ncbi:MAG: helix-turn-helix domain-containing protein [Dehalococcoidia bacterium]
MGEIGTRLVRAREARGLTLEDAERDTRISRRYLLALESEQFQVIPAPVYARGFLRSYSQYLGEDAQDILSFFPRDDDDDEPEPVINSPGAKRSASRQSPLSGHSPSRPAWKRPPRPVAPTRRESPPAAPPAPTQPPAGRPQPAAQPAQGQPAIDFTRRGGPAPVPNTALPPPPEPMIGVDIGVPAPARRLNPGGSGQVRTLVVVGIALGALIGVVLLALLIANLGGDDPPQSAASGSPAPQTTQQPARTAVPGASTGIPVIRGVVPDVKGQPLEAARAAIVEAGYRPAELRRNGREPRNTVLDQSPAAGSDLPEGNVVNLVVSDGPQ